MANSFTGKVKNAASSGWVQLFGVIAASIGLFVGGMEVQSSIASGEVQSPEIVADAVDTTGEESAVDQATNDANEEESPEEEPPVATSEPVPLNQAVLHDEISTEFADVGMATVAYENVLLMDMDTGAEAEFRIDRKYSTFQGVVGLSDNSDSDISETLTIVSENGDLLYENTFSLGEVEDVEIDIASYQRIIFQLSYDDKSRSGWLAVSGVFNP